MKTKLPSRLLTASTAIICLFSSSILLAKMTHFKNMNGYSINSKGELDKFNQFIVDQDTIVAIGTPAANVAVDETIDMQGKTVLPGLIDAHGHIIGLGDYLLQVDLRGAKSEQEAVDRVLQFVGKQSLQTSEKTSWVMGDGWNQVLWPAKNFPSKVSLDKALPNVAVVLSRVDGHAVWVNSKALKLAGIDANTLSPAGGEIVKDQNGEPTGLLIDNAGQLLQKVIPTLTQRQLQERLDVALQHLVALGITSAHDAGVSQEIRDLYVQNANNQQLKMRIYAMLSATDANLVNMLKAGHFSDADDMLHIRSVKAYGDGALGSRGAALLQPYSDDPDNRGLLITPEERLSSVFNTVIGANFQLNFHAIGDRANRLALQQFQQTFLNFPENSQRHRIEHAQIVALEDIPLFKEYGIIPSMQPTHATSDMNMAEDRIGKARLKGAYAWQTFLKQGTRVAFGSDFPVELANVFHGLHAAVTRQNANQSPDNGWLPSEKVSRIDALRGFTLDAAYAAFQEEIIGSIEVQKKADFIVIDGDYFELPEKEIRNIQVLQTYVNGELVYKK